MYESITNTKEIDKEFLQHVSDGLDAYPKKLSSKYLYDKKGDAIFQAIMNLEEYYLTRAEYDIFEMFKTEILELFSPKQGPFNLIEFGAGDGYKTKVLLKHFIEKGADFEYLPIDISQNALDGLEKDLKEELPDLKFSGLQGDYFEVLDKLSHSSDKRNIILFLGSNIGNFTEQESISFLSGIRKDIHKGDMLFIGIDLKKDPETILNAYHDKKGVTRDFNFNLLERINNELGGNFDITKFRHAPSYDPVTGECKSCLLSTENQKVSIQGKTYKFNKWETIHTEVSKKYAIREIHELANKAGFDVIADLKDKKGDFVDSIWEAM